MEPRERQSGIYDIQLEYVRVFVLGRGEGVISRGEGVTLIDSGFERTATDLVGCLDREFGTIGRLILTHDGPDHYGDVEAVMERFDPELYAAAAEHSLLEAIDRESDVTFEHVAVLDSGIEIVQVPRHTPVPSALLLREEGVLISGDVLGGADRPRLSASNLLSPLETYNHGHAAAAANLDRLLDYDFDAVLVFHGSRP